MTLRNEADLFSEKQWSGMFFLPGQESKKFLGKVSFSPGNGVVFSYSIDGLDVPPESEILHGKLDSGEICTLVGNFSFGDYDYSITRKGKKYAFFLVLGDFINEGEDFHEEVFSLSGMQEFFFPEGHKDKVKYSKTPLLEIETDYGIISFRNKANYAYLAPDITAQIDHQNPSALAELKSAFEKIKAQYGDSPFWLKQDISYMVTIEANPKATIDEIYDHIFNLCRLFSILIFQPVYPEYIKLKRNSKILSVYPTLLLSEGTIDQSKRRLYYPNMPINNSKIDLKAVITKWLEDPKKYSTIVESIQYETGLRNPHSLHGELLLYASQFEEISYNDEVEKKDRYVDPVNKYATADVKDKLSLIFTAAGEDDLGKGISDLRNEIAHAFKPRNLLEKFKIMDKVKIAQLMQITIIGYVLEKLGVERNLIEDYQKRFSPSNN